jgi:hypothetical protein
MDTLEDFLETYPLQSDPDYQYKISKKEEFIRLSGKAQEEIPEKGKKFKHQEYILRIMKTNNRIYIFDQMGTGKTCTMIGLAEYFKKTGLHKNIYILEKGESTKSDFKSQLSNRCTCDLYNQKAADEKKTTVDKLIAFTYTITTYHGFIKEAKKLNDCQIIANYSNTVIMIDEAHNLRNVNKEKKNNPSTHSNKKSYEIIEKICRLVKSCIIVIATGTPNINNVGDFIPTVNLLLPENKRLKPHFEYSENNRNKGFSTKYDYRYVTLNQMEPFLRGILTYVRSSNTGIQVNYMGVNMERDISIEHVDIYCRLDPLLVEEDGKFVYKEQVIPDEVIIKEKRKSQTIVYPIRMSEFQSKIFLKALENIGKGPGSKKRVLKQHASEFVFPDGSYGGNPTENLTQEKKLKRASEPISGFEKYIQRSDEGIFVATQELKEVLADPLKLWKCSCKFYEILRIEEQNPNSSAFIYSENVIGSGTILLSLMLEEHGYTSFEGDNSAFTDGVIKIDKRKRYAFISKEKNKNPNIMELFNSDQNCHGEYIKIMIGSPLSRDGINLYNVLRGYLFRAGWHPSGDLQAMARFLRATSHEALIKELKEKNPDVEPKIKVEIYRMCSYTYDGAKDSDDDIEDFEEVLVPEKKSKKVSSKKISSQKPSKPVRKTLTEKKPSKSLKNKSLKRRFSGKFMCRASQRKSTDIQLYISGELKDFYNKRMMRIWKCLAINAMHNKERNMLESDVDLSAEADYSTAKYMLWCEFDKENRERRLGKDNDEVDYSTYDVYYIEEDIKNLYNEIVEHLIIKGYINIEEILKIWIQTKKYREKVLWYVLEKISSEKNEIINRYGLPSYINNDGSNLFLQIDYPFYDTRKTNNLLYYSNLQVGILNLSINKTIDNILAESPQQEIIDIIMSMKLPETESEIKEFNSYIDKLNVTYKAKLIEKALSIYMKTDQVMCDNMRKIGLEVEEEKEASIPEIIGYIINIYSRYIHFNVYEPIKDIDSVALFLNTKVNKGRKGKPVIKIKYQEPSKTGLVHKNGDPYEVDDEVEEDDVKQLNMVYIHTIYSRENHKTGYLTSIKFKNVSGKIRIFKPSEKMGWRDLTPFETPVYSNLIDKEILAHESKIISLSKNKIYGILFPIQNSASNYTFHVVEGNSSASNKKSEINRGRECKKNQKSALIKILITENITTNTLSETKVNMDRDEMIEYLLNTQKFTVSHEDIITYSDANLISLCKWFLSGIKRDEMCEILKNFLQDKGRIIKN